MKVIFFTENLRQLEINLLLVNKKCYASYEMQLLFRICNITASESVYFGRTSRNSKLIVKK